jgi:hypothetical protein
VIIYAYVHGCISDSGFVPSERMDTASRYDGFVVLMYNPSVSAAFFMSSDLKIELSASTFHANLNPR